MTHIPYSPDPYIQPKKKNRTVWIVLGTAAAAVVATFAVVLGIGWYLVDGPGAEKPQDSNYAQTLAAEITTCGNHDRPCHAENAIHVGQLKSELVDPTPQLTNAITDFENQFSAFKKEYCGTNTMDVMCGITGVNLNLAASTIKAEMGQGDTGTTTTDVDNAAYGSGQPQSNPNLGNRDVEVLRKAVPSIANNSDTAIADAADGICSEMRRGVTPRDAAASFSNEVDGVTEIDGRLFALSASLEFCPDVLPEDAFTGGR